MGWGRKALRWWEAFVVVSVWLLGEVAQRLAPDVGEVPTLPVRGLSGRDAPNAATSEAQACGVREPERRSEPPGESILYRFPMDIFHAPPSSITPANLSKIPLRHRVSARVPSSSFYAKMSSRMTASRMRSPQDSRSSRVAEPSRALAHSGNSPNRL